MLAFLFSFCIDLLPSQFNSQSTYLIVEQQIFFSLSVWEWITIQHWVNFFQIINSSECWHYILHQFIRAFVPAWAAVISILSRHISFYAHIRFCSKFMRKNFHSFLHLLYHPVMAWLYLLAKKALSLFLSLSLSLYQTSCSRPNEIEPTERNLK
jgi:hypothetical protein